MKDPRKMSKTEIDAELQDLEKFFKQLFLDSKMTRSLTVTIRLTPRTAYYARIAANKDRRTLSSWIERAIERALAERP